MANTLRGRLLAGEGTARLNGLNLPGPRCARIQRIVIVACGTSWHAGLVGRQIIEQLAGIPVTVEYASEYRYHRPLRRSGDPHDRDLTVGRDRRYAGSAARSTSRRLPGHWDRQRRGLDHRP